MKLMKTVSVTFCLFLSAQGMAQNGVWQWATAVKNYSSKKTAAPSTAYLWIPENCRKVRAVIVAQHNMEEISILEDEGFRKQMSRLGVAEVWVCPRFNLGFDFTDGAWETLDGILKALADKSGYEELATTKIIGIGHSAAASNPYYMAAYKPDRVAACISVSGQWPYHRDNGLCPDIWGNRTIDRIPCLETMGEYEAAATWSSRGLKDRAEHPGMPLSMLVCPGEGHFAYSPEKARYIALFIRKALEYGHVDPTRRGWLAERWKRDGAPSCLPAPINKYKGKTEEAFWFFDKEMAEATVAYGERFRGLKPQLLGIEQGGKPVEQRNTHLQLHPKFVTGNDSRSIRLKPFFLDTVPAVSNRLADWAQLAVGSSLGHSQKDSPYLTTICGVGRAVDNETLLLEWNRSTSWNGKNADITFAIRHDGDGEYKPAVQQGIITLPVRQKKGRVQRISFEPPADVVRGTKAVCLQAHSDCGLPVSFYVESGPARIDGNRLIFTAIPPKSRYPVCVTVTAWQYGSEQGGIQTAEPVTREFHIREK